MPDQQPRRILLDPDLYAHAKTGEIPINPHISPWPEFMEPATDDEIEAIARSLNSEATDAPHR